MVFPGTLPGRGLRPLERQSSLLFHWRSRDLSLRAVTGELGVISRASVGTTIDPLGRVITVPAGQERWIWIGGVPYLLLEQSRTNVLWRSTQFDSASTVWTSAADFTVTTKKSIIVGQTAYEHRNLGTVGSRSRAQSRGTHPAGPQTLVLIVENVDAANTFISIRDAVGHVATGLLTWSSGAYTVTAGSGSSISGRATLLAASGPNGGATYRLELTATAPTPGSARSAFIYPTATSQNTEAVILHYAGLEEAPCRSSEVVTGDASGSRAGDFLYWDYLALPRAMSVLATFVEMGAVVTPNARLWQISDAASADPRVMIATSGTLRYSGVHDTGATSLNSTLGSAPSIGQRAEVLTTLDQTGAVQASQSIEGGTETSAVRSAANALQPAWSGNRVYANSGGTSGHGLVALESLKIAAGVRTLAEMRAAF